MPPCHKSFDIDSYVLLSLNLRVSNIVCDSIWVGGDEPSTDGMQLNERILEITNCVLKGGVYGKSRTCSIRKYYLSVSDNNDKLENHI